MSVIAVAGISGYTGLRLLPRLAQSVQAGEGQSGEMGVEARLLLRRATAAKSPWKDDARVVSVDLLDEAALETALRGVDTIVCLVGTTKRQFRAVTAMEPAVNYETVDIGIPRALATAGARVGVARRVLLTSYGIDAPGAYPAAKRAAEEAVRKSGLKHVFIRPSFIAGPLRAAPRALDALWAPISRFARGFVDDIRSIDVEDLALAIFRIATTSPWPPEVDGQALSGRVLHRIAAEPSAMKI
ncbi:MAG: hypothetical protein NVSMB1_16800 [Polyangiales bacterium]